MEDCLKNGTYSYRDLKKFAIQFKPLAVKVIWIAADA
jgi:hypothetical protein